MWLKIYFRQTTQLYTNIYLAIKNRLSKRNKAETGIRYEWFALQRCAATYYEEFEKEKIVWPEVGIDNQVGMVQPGAYLNKTTFFIPMSDNYLLGILNSKVVKFFLDSIVSKMRGGYYMLSKIYMETIPIVPPVSNSSAIRDKVKIFLAEKKLNSEIDTETLEAEIDQLVYQLYNLTEAEIQIIENATA